MKRLAVNILIFSHCWSSEKKYLSPPYDSFVKSFQQLGYDIKIIWSNELIKDLTKLSPKISEDRIIRFIRKIKPVLVVAVNNGGMTKRIREAIACPVLKWLFDDYPHLFFNNSSQDLTDGFKAEDRIFCYSSFLAGEIRERHAEIATNVEFVPHAASLVDGVQASEPVDIVFLGNLLDYKTFAGLLKHFNGLDPMAAHKLIELLKHFRQDYSRSFDSLIELTDLTPVLEQLKPHGWETASLKRALSDVISAQDRILAVNKLSDLGLVIYGNPEWLESLIFTSKICNCYQFGKSIKTTPELMGVYQNSKISIDIPNIQNVNALSNRFFDVMGSSSLLITKFQEHSDAWAVFGPDCPIPMYRNLDHLHELCEYFLTHEDERQAIVHRCNELVRHHHSHLDRAIYAVGKFDLPSNEAPLAGSLEFLKTKIFSRDQNVIRYLKRMGRKGIKKARSFLNVCESAVT